MTLQPFLCRLGSHQAPAFSPEETVTNPQLGESHPSAPELLLQRLRLAYFCLIYS